MAIQLEGTPVSANGGSGAVDSLTIPNVTVPGGLSNSILVVGIAQAVGTDAVTGVTYGGVSLTRAGFRQSGASGNDCSAYIYYLVNPSAGTADVVISFASVNFRPAAGAMVFSGVDQTTPFGTAAGNSANSTGPATVNVSSASGELVIDAVAKRDSAGAISVGASQTEHWQDETTSVTVAANIVGASSTEPGAATVTMSWSWVLPVTNVRWAIVGAPLKPAAAATTSFPFRRRHALPTAMMVQ